MDRRESASEVNSKFDKIIANSFSDQELAELRETSLLCLIKAVGERAVNPDTIANLLADLLPNELDTNASLDQAFGGYYFRGILPFSIGAILNRAAGEKWSIPDAVEGITDRLPNPLVKLFEFAGRVAIFEEVLDVRDSNRITGRKLASEENKRRDGGQKPAKQPEQAKPDEKNARRHNDINFQKIVDPDFSADEDFWHQIATDLFEHANRFIAKSVGVGDCPFIYRHYASSLLRAMIGSGAINADFDPNNDKHASMLESLLMNKSLATAKQVIDLILDTFNYGISVEKSYSRPFFDKQWSPTPNQKFVATNFILSLKLWIIENCRDDDNT
jgi:hypothetical protein